MTRDLPYHIIMLKRAITNKLSSLAKKFPVVSITGPRQSGKTTLVKMCFARHDYVSLEDPDERGFAHSDPRGFLRRFNGRSVILEDLIYKGIHDKGLEPYDWLQAYFTTYMTLLINCFFHNTLYHI